MDKSLVNLTAHEARDMLDRGDVSSLELTEASLERIEEIDDRVKAFVTVTRNLALEQAREADVRIAEGNAAPLTYGQRRFFSIAKRPQSVTDHISSARCTCPRFSRSIRYTPP